jgi:hypothetical protein
MTKTLGEADLDRAMDRLFAVYDGRPGPIGMALLREFALARPVDFGFWSRRISSTHLTAPLPGLRTGTPAPVIALHGR